MTISKFLGKRKVHWKSRHSALCHLFSVILQPVYNKTIQTMASV